MNFNDYQQLAKRTAPVKTKENETVLVSNFSMGLAGETGEVVDYLKKVYFHGHELNQMELAKELGDVLWYVANLSNIHNIPLQEVAEMNIEKLKKRYPDGFSADKSINRKE